MTTYQARVFALLRAVSARQWAENERGPVVVLGLLHHSAQYCEAARRLDLARRAGLWTEARTYTR